MTRLKLDYEFRYLLNVYYIKQMIFQNWRGLSHTFRLPLRLWWLELHYSQLFITFRNFLLLQHLADNFEETLAFWRKIN